MINVNQLTAQLRMLPDAALQRVAQMYKNDPYILPMVVSEGMARKKLRAAGQAQAAQPQPKVADQAVAAMAPEDAGIAQLQAPNMQSMADGGIAGYGDDFEFAQRSEPVVRMAKGGVARFQQGGQSTTGSTLAQVQAPVMEELKVLQAQLAEAERVLGAAAKSGDAKSVTQYARAVQDIRDKMGALASQSFGNRAPQVLSSLTAPAAAAAQPAATAYGDVPSSVLAAYGPGAERMPQAAPAPAPSAPPPAPSAGARTPAAPTDGGIYSLAGRLYDPIEARTRAQLGRMRMAGQQRGEEEQIAFEAGKPKGKAYEGLEGLLKKEAEGEAGEREQAKAMAIFNAGLAMMAGSSPRALENIAKGAMVGSGQYAEAIKDFKKAAKERQKMMASIEEARRAEARDDNKTALALMQRANDHESKMEMFALEATTGLGFKKADLTGRLYGTQMELSSRERLSRMPSADMQLIERIAQERKIPFAEAFEYVVGAKQAPRTRQQMMEDWSKSLILQQRYKSAKEYADAQMGAGGGLNTAGINLGQWGEPQVVGGR